MFLFFQWISDSFLLFCFCDNCQLSLIFEGRLHGNLMPLYNLLYEVPKHYLNFVILLFLLDCQKIPASMMLARYWPYIFEHKTDNFSEDKLIMLYHTNSSMALEHNWAQNHQYQYQCSSKLTILKKCSVWYNLFQLFKLFKRNANFSRVKPCGSCGKSSFLGLLKLIFFSKDGSTDLRLRFHLQSWLVTADLFSWILQHTSSLKSKAATWLQVELKLANNPANNYLFKINNRNTISKVWNMFQFNNKNSINVILVSLWLIFNIFHTLLYLVFLLLTLNR